MQKVTEVLAGLREEQRRLQVELSGVERAIAALEEVLGVERTAVAGLAEAPRVEPAAVAAPEESAPRAVVAKGPYATYRLFEAVSVYLAGAEEPKTARQIAEALEAGGYPTHSANFPATVRTMLRRSGPSLSDYGIREVPERGRWFASDDET